MFKYLIPVLIGLIFSHGLMAQDYGLLLGLRQSGNYNLNTEPSSESEENANQEVAEMPQQLASYRTLWIRTDNKGHLKLGTEKTSLLVPREDGFWRVDVKHSAYNDFNEDFIWINPAPDPDMPPNPFLANREGIAAFDVAVLVKSQGIEFQKGENCIGHRYRDILFVGKDHLSASLLSAETCRGTGGSVHENGLQFFTMEDLELVEFSELFEDETESGTFEETANRYRERHQDQGGEQWGEPSAGITRHKGKWIFKGHFSGKQGEYHNFNVDLAVPENLIKHDKLFPNWEVIKTHVPEAVDAFSSPDQKYLVVFTPANVLGYSLEEGKIPVQPSLHLSISQPVNVIMAEWTEGQYVENWSQELESLSPKPGKNWFSKAESKAHAASWDNFKMYGVTTSLDLPLNVHEGVGEYTNVVGRMEKYTPAQVIDILGDWYKVELAEGQVGYASKHHVKLLPKLPYIQAACPVPNCSYGKWLLKSPLTLYANPSLEARAITQLKAQQEVQAIKGQIHTTQYGVVEVSKRGSVAAIPTDVASIENKESLNLTPGEILFDLETRGEGLHVVWYQGKLYYLEEGWDAQTKPEADLWGKAIVERKTDWWVEVEIPDKNLQGWIVNPQL